jgi:peptidyl-tRNA hydrolase
MAQAAHASTAVLHLYRDHEDVKEYLSRWQDMRKSIMIVSSTMDSRLL